LSSSPVRVVRDEASGSTVLSPKNIGCCKCCRDTSASSAHNISLKEVWARANLKNTNYLQILVRRLRRKIEQDPKQPRFLVSELGVYRLASGEAE
jgi:hypothetical protein